MSHPVALWMGNPFALSSFSCWSLPNIIVKVRNFYNSFYQLQK
jgi:hypothetical protein